jgi:hypothetical protein
LRWKRLYSLGFSQTASKNPYVPAKFETRVAWA